MPVRACVGVDVSMFEIHMFYRTCPSWHLHVAVVEADSGRYSSGIYTGKKMAAREVGGQRGSQGKGTGGG